MCAPASLKGVLSAAEAAGHLAAGVRDAGGQALELPVADGGEGTADALFRARGGRWHEASVRDPLGRRITARFLVLPDGTAVVEVAAAVGLPLVQPEERSPLVLTTHGVGDLVLAALERRPDSVLVCLGGSATVDGGRGMREVIGTRLHDIPVEAACDVRNPLLGAVGAAAVFGPQKGAGPEDVARLEALLAADLELRPFATMPGAGAAGGLGAAFAALGAKLRSGAELVLESLRFGERIADAALVVTGEGQVDLTTFAGKAPGSVLSKAEESGVPALLFGGRVASDVFAMTTLVALSGDPRRAGRDLRDLGRSLPARLAA